VAVAAWFAAGALTAGAAGVAFGFASGRRARQAVGRLRGLERAVSEFRTALRARLDQERARYSRLARAERRRDRGEAA